jgi:hypothetical protein
MDTQKLGTVAWDLIIWRLSDPATLINLGWVKALDITTDTDSERVDIAAHNRTAITGNSPAGIIAVQFLENIDAEKISVLTGATVTVTAATLVAGAIQTALADSYAFNQFIKIANQNGNWSVIVVNSVTAGTDGLLVDWTDYEVGQNSAGEYGIFILDSLTVTTVSQAMVIGYDYTPNASVTCRNTRKYQNDVLLGAKIVTAANDAGEVNTYTLESCIFKGQYKISVLDLAIAGDLDGTTGALELSRGADIVHNIETL